MPTHKQTRTEPHSASEPRAKDSPTDSSSKNAKAGYFIFAEVPEAAPRAIPILVLPEKKAAEYVVEVLRHKHRGARFAVKSDSNYDRAKIHALALMVLDVSRGYYGDDFRWLCEDACKVTPRRLRDAVKQSTPSSQSGGRGTTPGGEGETLDKELPPSRVKAKAAYEWAIEAIGGAGDIPLRELLPKIRKELDSLIEAAHPGAGEAEKLREFRDSLPSSPETFGKYLRDAGIKRYSTKGDRIRSFK